ncbi:MAG: glycine--tRNA ligase subunit beta [Desulfuromonadaceae bacterium]|nr:glycine--tRNA ligase subunit beta [Desulfuromonadaceae bacterium]
MAKELFLEIGTEEIPAGFIPVALRELERMFSAEFSQMRIEHGAITTVATPRRLAISVSDVAEMQQQQHIEATGPALKVAYDAQGNPTKAALGFARSQGVDISELEEKQTEKGAYLFISKVVEGQEVKELLPAIMQRVVSSLSFKKSMRWKDMDIRFARPVHWLVALYGGEVVPFEYGNLTTADESRGHRFMAPGRFRVSSFADYLSKCRAHHVIVDPQERKKIITDGIEQIVAEVGGTLNPDAELLDEVVNLVEFPVPLCGHFDAEFLQLPAELLITSMKEHQRYFTLSDSAGKLLPRFITISNIKATDPAVVINGNERVLRARLADGMFFWQEDQKQRLESRLESLKQVVYQQQLGTSYAKVERFTDLARYLAQTLDPDTLELTERAATLAKCDLETGMVNEFPELQGVMGREYALLEGENERVAKAIYEHYLPIQAGGKLPSDNVGAFVSIADKVDTICGCFGVGLIPTGTADPYALRRSAIGILNIILARGFTISIPTLVHRAVAQLTARLTRPADEVERDVVEFIRLRFVNMLTGQGVAGDVVDAVLSAGFDQIMNVRQRVDALNTLKNQADFEPLAATFKRAGNIISGGVEAEVNPGLFEAPCEDALYAALGRVRTQVEAAMRESKYLEALHAIATLRPAVDSFFDDVMVMAENEKVKTNRLALLTDVTCLFSGLADFSRLAA